MSRRTPTILTVLITLVASFTVLGASGVQASPHAADVGAVAPVAPAATSTVGRPPLSYVPTSRAYFSYPNRTSAEAMVIRDRVLKTIRSTWGGPRTPAGMARQGNGTIRIATWSFNDWAIAKALVAARNRGVSVQVVAARGANREYAPWQYLKRRFGQRLYRPGYPETRDRVSFARDCPGSCRGRGGTPHAKYFLFDHVGADRVRNVLFQTSMNLTRFAYKGQWNQAQVMKSKPVYDDFMTIFREARIGRPVPNPYHVKRIRGVVDMFYPRPGAGPSQDMVMQTLDRTLCRGAVSGGNANGRTRIRIIQYAMYGDRGVWIAKKLRSLWGRGCDIKIIYSLSTRPVLQILRSRSGRGPIPMRQSVVRNNKGEYAKYNHSKWMTVTGRWSPSRSAWLTLSGSGNWSLPAFSSDEQAQRISSRTQALHHMNAFDKTWRQRTSKAPAFGRTTAFGRVLDSEALLDDVPEDDIPFGEGIYRYMTP